MTGDETAPNQPPSEDQSPDLQSNRQPPDLQSNRHSEVPIRVASAADMLDVRRILDAAMLDVDSRILDQEESFETGNPGEIVLIARCDRTGGVIGAVVVSAPTTTHRHIDAIAVRRERRAQGIGSALVTAVIDRAASDETGEAVTAAFDRSLRDFYGSLGFEIRAEPDEQPPVDIDASVATVAGPDRLWGVFHLDARG